MELSSVTPQSAAAASAAQIRSEHAVLAASTAISAIQSEGQMLVQLIAQAGGLGQNINTTA